MKQHLENQMIEWKQKNTEDGKFEHYIREVCPENVKIDDSGAVVWVDERLKGPKWQGTFEKLKATDPLHQLGELPQSEKEMLASQGADVDGDGDDDGDGSGSGSVVSVDTPEPVRATAASPSPTKFWAEIYGVYGSEMEPEGEVEVARRRSRCSDVFGSDSSDDDTRETAAQRRRRLRKEKKKAENGEHEHDSDSEPPSPSPTKNKGEWGMFGFW